MGNKERIPVRIAKLHRTFARLGQPGRTLTKWLALYSLYVIFSNGGVEALAVICHEYILNRVKENQKHAGTNVNPSARP